MHISPHHLSRRFELKRYDVVTTLNTVNEKMRTALVIFYHLSYIVFEMVPVLMAFELVVTDLVIIKDYGC